MLTQAARSNAALQSKYQKDMSSNLQQQLIREAFLKDLRKKLSKQKLHLANSYGISNAASYMYLVIRDYVKLHFERKELQDGEVGTSCTQFQEYLAAQRSDTEGVPRKFHFAKVLGHYLAWYPFFLHLKSGQ